MDHIIVPPIAFSNQNVKCRWFFLQKPPCITLWVHVSSCTGRPMILLPALMSLKNKTEQAPSTAPAVPRVCRQQLPAWALRAGTKHCPHCPRSVHGPCICTAHIEGTVAGTCWGKSQPAPKLKAAPWFWERWQSRRTWTLLLSRKHQNHNYLLNNHQEKWLEPTKKDNLLSKIKKQPQQHGRRVPFAI